MMRFLLATMVLGLGALVIVTFTSPGSVLAAAGERWFPAEVGLGAERVDGLFDLTNKVAVTLLVLTFTVLAAVVFRGAGRRAGEGSQRRGSSALEASWTVVPAGVVLFLTWSQVGVREAVAADATAGAGEPLTIHVEGAQFDWHFTYAGADGAFGTLDDVTSVVDMPVPVGRPVRLRMESVDVIHSFFVPALRMKRDVVPGTVVPLNFTIDPADHAAAGSPRVLELRCAELCGWGHYAMVGRLLPMDDEAFGQWLAAAGAARFAPDGGDDDAGADEEDER